ncbi:MAG: T9SS type A sorting domain-containing protein, partial [Bacteroidales bacterium]|nr:T9SS type A sorting domain-containing protein [Bacteroidales bacterium]
KDISLYPNPVMSTLNIKLPAKDKPVPVAVLSQQGQELITDSIPAGNSRYTLDVHHLSPGNYILKINGISKSFTVVR